MLRRTTLLVILGLLVLLLAVVSLSVGSTTLPLRELLAALFGDGPDPTTRKIVRELRLPRVALAILVGAALSTSGAAYQALFRNPMADPFVIGTASGAAFGASLVIALGLSLSTLGLSSVSLGAFVGALSATGVVVAIGSVARHHSTVSLLLAGMAVSSFLSAVVWLLLTLNSEVQGTILSWMMGSFAERDTDVIWQSLPFLLLGVGMLMLAARPLDALTLGEPTARAIGLPVRWAMFGIIVGASLATAAAVAASGIIGFVGLITPHIARKLVGSHHIWLLPASALCGAILLLVADIVARLAIPPNDLRVGIITAILGGPFFLVILFRKGPS